MHTIPRKLAQFFMYGHVQLQILKGNNLKVTITIVYWSAADMKSSEDSRCYFWMKTIDASSKDG